MTKSVDDAFHFVDSIKNTILPNLKVICYQWNSEISYHVLSVTDTRAVCILILFGGLAGCIYNS